MEDKLDGIWGEKYIITIDQSTSATKAILFDQKGQLLKRETMEHEQFYPRPGWVEHDAEQIYQNTIELVKELIQNSKVKEDKIAALAITNQRETTVVWDKQTGKPICNAIVWQCQRGKDICNKFKEQDLGDLIRDKTGLVLDPYFSASKIKWILDNVEGARKKAESGRLLFGTIDTWLLWKMTEGEVHATDYSNASRTMLYNIYDLKWDQELLDLFQIPSIMMPEVKSSNEIFGYSNFKDIFKEEIPISGLLGDSQAALFGQNCFEKGMAKTTYGTGSSVMMNIGKNGLKSDQGLVTSLAWGLDGEIDYVFEGNVHATGATIKWLVDKLKLIDNPVITEKLANSLQDNEGVYFVPAFVGLGAPHWDNEARATISGLTFGAEKAHVVRAALEAIAYQIKDVLDLMIKESGIDSKEIRVDGGASNNSFLIQFQADMLDIPVVRTDIEEVSALGSTLMAGLAVGLWEDLAEINNLEHPKQVFTSKIDNQTRQKYYNGWKEAVNKILA